MGIVEQDKSCCKNTGREGVSRLPHNVENNRYSQSAEESRHGTVGNIWDLVRDIGVADVLEVEAPIITNEPAHQRKQKLSEGRMDIEEVRAFEIVRSKLIVDS